MVLYGIGIHLTVIKKNEKVYSHIIKLSLFGRGNRGNVR